MLLIQKLKIPSLLIEGAIVDIRLFDLADALKKTEAFEEIMDYYKEIEKAKDSPRYLRGLSARILHLLRKNC